MSYLNLNLNLLSNEHNAFKNLRIGRLFGKKVVTTSYVFSREEVLQQMGGVPEFPNYSNDKLEVFITVENGQIFVYLDGQNSGGIGGNPQGVAKSPG
ncbi:hypothetical protein GVN16_08535 [Emticicia sp. CRIBPO]|uniref:hypothetical protein n=1 Tax=Emticicia sp. CRIBPO TaxID=2683258 RepID=UPI001412A566|nr:hypothetical protein [Emticicia sp. CRIBPO]NBA85803.1 hypothetical protein [Emticicia sp. CRIBPO]